MLVSLFSTSLLYILINLVDAELKVCSFNVQAFGITKAKKANVVDKLTQILKKYDLCLIQEIREKGDDAKERLVNMLNGIDIPVKQRRSRSHSPRKVTIPALKERSRSQSPTNVKQSTVQKPRGRSQSVPIVKSTARNPRSVSQPPKNIKPVTAPQRAQTRSQASKKVTTVPLQKALTGSQPPKNVYKSETSPRLGRSTSTEEYLFIYNSKKLQVIDSYVFPNSSGLPNYELFERPPFIVRFQLMKGIPGKVNDFFIIGIHTKPDDAKPEVGNLTSVYMHAAKKYQKSRGIIMGDFNADCSYFSQKALETNPLRVNDQFEWLIKDSDNTNLGKQACAYDRIVVDQAIKPYIKNPHTRYYSNEPEFNLDYNQTKAISDHYPVEFTIL